MPIPRKPLRLDGYVRVSDVGGRSGASFISPTVQRERITAWCSSTTLAYSRCSRSSTNPGGRTDRSLLLAAIERVEDGLSDGIIVAKLDRFGRSFKDALEHIERIDRAGGRRISVQDQFDLGTDHGRLVLEWTRFRGQLRAFAVRPRKDGVRRASNPTCLPAGVPS